MNKIDTILKDILSESVMDFPSGKRLTNELWEKCGTRYTLKPHIKEIFISIVEYIKNKLDIDIKEVRVVGSLCSNTYSDSSDVDLHFSVDGKTSKEKCLELTKQIRKLFKTPSKRIPPTTIGSHRIELYVQSNVYYDMMSVGCYDVYRDEWITGPQILPVSFNPFIEYYEDIINNFRKNNILNEIREDICNIGEMCKILLLNNRSNNVLIKKLKKSLADDIEDINNLKEKIKDMRSINKAPSSKEDALKLSSSREWRINDASYKILDKLGYLKILRELSNVEDKSDYDHILDIIKTNLFVEN